MHAVRQVPFTYIGEEQIVTLSLHCFDLMEQIMHLESKIKYGSLSLLYKILSFEISSRDPW